MHHANKTKLIIGIGAAFAVLSLLWLLRTAPIVHDTIMHFWSNYPKYLIPVLIALIAAAPFAVKYGLWVRKQKVLREAEEAKEADRRTQLESGSGFQSYRNAPYHPRIISLPTYHVGFAQGTCMVISTIIAVMGIVAFGILYSAAVGQRIANDNTYGSISGLPAMKSVRTLPFTVMDNMANNGFSSTTEELENGHMMATQDGRLMFTHEVTPSGAIRRRGKMTSGIATQDPTVTERTLKVVKSKEGFPSAPSTKGWFFKPGAWDRAMRVAAYRKHYLVNIKEYSAIATPSGEVLFIAPYTKPKGFLIRRQVLGGVFVAHADGRIEDLTIDEARKRPELASTGRLIPESYVRAVHENIRYRTGLLNGKFGRKDVYVLSDEDDTNKQPYLTVLADGRPAWVSTAEPKGKSTAAGAVFVTDAVTAKTEIWKPTSGQFVTGPEKALGKIKERPISGIQWGSGNYLAVEPRPLFIDGQLHYLISITNAEETGLVKSVIFNAHRDRVVATFDHDTGGVQADKDLVQYIQTGKSNAPSAPAENPEQTNTEPTEPPAGDLKTLTDAQRDQVIEQLIQENTKQRELLERLRK